MITLCPKFHKCPYTGLPAEILVLEDGLKEDYLRYFISSAALKKFMNNLHYRCLVKLPVEAKSKEIMDQLAKLDNPIYLILNESPAGADVAHRVRLAQEVIHLAMPTAVETVASFAIEQYQTQKNAREFDEVKNQLWEQYIENTNQRLSLKKKKLKLIADFEKEKLDKIYGFFFKLVEKLYKDFLTGYRSQRRKAAFLKGEKLSGPKNPFIEENKAFEPFNKTTQFLSKVKNEKAKVPVQSPYATFYDSDLFYEKKCYEYEIPKAVPDIGFNHFRELCKVQRSDYSLILDFTSNAQNVTNTTFFTLFESLPKFDHLKTLSIDISGAQNCGAVGFGYLRAGLLKLQLESFYLKATGCQGMNDACVDNIVKGLEKSSNLTSFYLYAPKCQRLTENAFTSICRLAKRHKTLRKLAIDFSGNNNLTDTGLQSIKKVFDDLGVLSHLELQFDKCENVSKKAKENIRFLIRNCKNIGCYKLS